MCKIENTDLNDLLKKTIEAKPEYVPPPPLIPIGRPVLGWKPQKKEQHNACSMSWVILTVLLLCLWLGGFIVGYFFGAM